ncbi:hypothetical protein EJD97_021867 [Solanum chilense]|uniref:TCP domain-containing protein n=1 Tax=Solanum chilense TaxID=4083 RepID=A0A6N2C7M6_SOLCI|nr:hypothetical protein EJD97_021867 [Solanum chilense]
MYPSSNYSPSSFFHINIPSPSMQYEPEFIQYFQDFQFIQPSYDQNTNIPTEEGADSDKLDKIEEDQSIIKSCNHKKDDKSSSSTSTIRRKNKRTTSRSAGVGPSKKDRHSKINTAHGPRDRRIRLSLEIAPKFFNLQDLLGFGNSKTLEWLFTKSKSAVNDLVQKINKDKCSGSKNPNIATVSSPSAESCEVISGVIDESAATNTAETHKQQKKKVKSIRRAIFHPVVAKESRKEARARARERTIIKKSLNDNTNNNNNGDQSMTDEDLTRSLRSWNTTFEDHQSGIQGYNNNNNMNVVDNFNLVDTSNWSPFMFNYHQINTEISQEHQLTNFQYSGKLWEA